MAKAATKYVCQDCGHESSRWMGRCAGCGEWNTLVEEAVKAASSSKKTWADPRTQQSKPCAITQVSADPADRFSSGTAELDRVLGGGIVPGSLGLVGGEPGIGKSTLLMQVAAKVAKERGPVLYVSGEESVTQLKLRAERLGVLTEKLQVVTESNARVVMGYVEELKPKLVLIDSIQTSYLEELSSAPGSVSQVRENATFFLQQAKRLGIPMILVGHVTKGGSFAGPKVLEHAVDYVLYFEGDSHNTFRLIRGVKNRFGSTNEVGIFDMTEKGLVEVANPSQQFLAQRPVGSSGSVVVPCMEGTRPLLVEVQALIGPTAFGGTPRRQTTGVDYQRFSTILAVLEKRQKYPLQNQDVFVNVAGGFRLTEPAADLGVAMAVTSSVRNEPIHPTVAVVGEIGLAGEIRAVSHVEQRMRELSKLGFETCIVPQGSVKERFSLRVVGVSTIQEALQCVFPNHQKGG